MRPGHVNESVQGVRHGQDSITKENSVFKRSARQTVERNPGCLKSPGRAIYSMISGFNTSANSLNIAVGTCSPTPNLFAIMTTTDPLSGSYITRLV